MSFQDAIRTCLQQKYVDFSGRARRSEYWFFALFYVIVQIVASIIDGILGTRSSSGTGLVSSLASLALLLPWLGASARRLHDTDRSGWWTLLWLIPVIGWIVLIVWWATDSKGDNKYGPNPKALGAGQAYQQMPPPAPQQF